MIDRHPQDLLRSSVVVAPMGGGPSTPGLVVAAGSAGALGFLAAGYKSAAAMRSEIDAVRAATADPFGVNVFVPGIPTRDRSALSAYLDSLAPDAEALGAELGKPVWDDDDWEAKIAVLLDSPPAVVSFTFGCPDAELVGALRAAGSQVWVTVTHPREALLATAAGVDALGVQGSEAGAHRGTFPNSPIPTDEVDLKQLLQEIAAVTALPLLAAGGIMDRNAVLETLAAGAVAVQCGTAFLRCPESGAHPVHKAALVDSRFDKTAVTRAFSGRPARGLVNRFMLDHPDAPAAYPEINNATRPLRGAAASTGDPQRMSLWAGAGYRAAAERFTAEIVEILGGG